MHLLGFPGYSDGKESACNAVHPRFDPWVGKIPWRREWQPTPVFLPGESHGQKSLAGYSPWGRKESDMAERLTLPFSALELTAGPFSCFTETSPTPYPWCPSGSDSQQIFSNCLASYPPTWIIILITKIYQWQKPCIVFLHCLSHGIYHTHFTVANLFFSCSKI